MINLSRILLSEDMTKNSKNVKIKQDELDITVGELKAYRSVTNTCEICKKRLPTTQVDDPEAVYLPVSVTNFHADHDHKTKRFRGLLCPGCNRSLGWYEKHKDEIPTYLQTHSNGEWRKKIKGIEIEPDK